MRGGFPVSVRVVLDADPPVASPVAEKMAERLGVRVGHVRNHDSHGGNDNLYWDFSL